MATKSSSLSVSSLSCTMDLHQHCDIRIGTCSCYCHSGPKRPKRPKRPTPSQ